LSQFSLKKECFMYFLLIGLITIACKYFEIAPVAAWSWWWVLSPLGAAVLWWWWADWSGYTIKQQEKKMDIRKQNRINKNKEALGMPISSRNGMSSSKKNTNRR
jgi:small Trp-rich protein